MSRFYASIQGSRGEATRSGGAASGIHGHIRGWNVGAYVECDVDEQGRDVVRVYKTGGSRGSKPRQLIAEYTE